VTQELIPREIVLCVNLALLIFIAVWAFQLTTYKRRLAKINEKQLEECFYLDCKVQVFGDIHCEEKTMYQGHSYNSSNITIPTVTGNLGGS